jgi:hypothetical protein
MRTTTDYMDPIDQITEDKLEPGKAMIIFVRDKAKQVSMYSLEVVEIAEEIKLVGYLMSGMKVAYQVDAGDHYFMSCFLGTNYVMKATVNAGRTYYVFLSSSFETRYKITPFAFHPVRRGKEKEEWKKYGFYKPNSKAYKWVDDYWEEIEKVKADTMVIWNNYTDEERHTFTLFADDGS